MIPALRVHDTGRRLCHVDGSPFFWLGDTAWELIHRLDKPETELYLKTRASQGFNVIQTVCLAELNGLREANREGHLPLVEEDPTRLNEPFWAHVDFVLSTAAKLGLYVGLLPTWGDKVSKAWGVGPVVFNEANAFEYGRRVAQRLQAHENIVWINGGDRDPTGTESIWRALALGLRKGDGERRSLITFHPQGERTSADPFHGDDWLDLNMMQTGHGSFDLDRVARMSRSCYEREPRKPFLDGEPCYENHPIGFDKRNGYFDEYQVRRAMYTSVFCGGCGVTYGCHAIWQFASDRHDPVNNPISHWRYSLGLPGANQVRHLKDLVLSLGPRHLLPGLVEGRLALTEEDGSPRAIYLPGPAQNPLQLSAGDLILFDPATGERKAISSSVLPPDHKDCVLILK